MFSEINVITVAFAVIFLMPVLIGATEPFSREKVRYSLGSLFDSIEFLAGLLLAIYLTRGIFFEGSTEEGPEIFRQIYLWIPEGVRTVLYGKDILTYIAAVPVLLLFLLMMLRVITNPVYKTIVLPISDLIYSAVNSMGTGFSRLVGALWQLPKSVYTVFIIGLLLSFSSYYISSPVFTKWLNESVAYTFVYNTAVYPVLNSNIAKKIPVLVNDSFRKTVGDITPGKGKVPAKTMDELAKRLKNGNIKVIEYFNGVTLDEAIKSSPEIDETARKIAGEEKNDKKKAYLLYKWVSRNIKYDYEKVKKVGSDPRGISSGSVEAYETRKGICFDYSCLYISMCRAAGLKVRLVTGLGYSGLSWGDHAWNQVYSSQEDRWINVDTTFGSAANYFDKPDFSVDHQYDEIQGEW